MCSVHSHHDAGHSKLEIVARTETAESAKDEDSEQSVDAEEGSTASPFREDRNTVFLGGIPKGLTSRFLAGLLKEWGVTVKKCSPIEYRQFGWSYVTLSSPEEAQWLISKSPIRIRDRYVDVRPFLNRRRIVNHVANKPSYEELLSAMMNLVDRRPDGLSVAEVQVHLFRRFSYRVDGPELIWMINRNPSKLFQQRSGNGMQELIYRTMAFPKMRKSRLRRKLSTLWAAISRHYFGPPSYEYAISSTELMDEFAVYYRAVVDPKDYGFRSFSALCHDLAVPEKCGFRLLDNGFVPHEEGSW